MESGERGEKVGRDFGELRTKFDWRTGQGILRSISPHLSGDLLSSEVLT